MKIEKHINTKKLLWKSHRLNNKNIKIHVHITHIQTSKEIKNIYIINNIIVVKLNQFITESQFTIKLYVLEC